MSTHVKTVGNRTGRTIYVRRASHYVKEAAHRRRREVTSEPDPVEESS